MRFALGVLTGLGLAWSALAIWHTIPPFKAVDPGDGDDMDEIVYHGRPSFREPSPDRWRGDCVGFGQEGTVYDAKRHAGMYP